MICPNCKSEMTVVEKGGVKLDHCTYCGGFWFDDGEWNILCKKMLSENFIPDILNIYKMPEIIASEKIKKCPVCKSEMEKFIFYGVTLDRCPEKHGIWFDKDEFLECINEMHPNSSQDEQLKFLADFFND